MWAEETLPQSLPATALTPGTDVPPGSVFAGQFTERHGAVSICPNSNGEPVGATKLLNEVPKYMNISLNSISQ